MKLLVYTLVSLSLGFSANAKSKLDVDAFNSIIEENAKLQGELTEKVREQAGIQKVDKKKFGTIEKQNRTIEIPTENIASGTNPDVMKQKDLTVTRAKSQTVEEIEKAASEIREAGRSE
jgi:hypothetical protein